MTSPRRCPDVMYTDQEQDAAIRVVHVGRQPIYDSTGQIYGFELLFRAGADAATAAKSTSYATSQVIVNAFTEFGVSALAGDKACFVNLTRDFLTGALPVPLAPEQAVLEVLETIEVDETVISGVSGLAEQGHRIALDDFVWDKGHDRLLPVASFVKLDLLNTEPELLERIARDCVAYPGLRLIGEKLETPGQMAFARRLGCSLFQGYALARPKVISTRVISPSRLRYVELLGLLARSDADISQVVEIVTKDPALSFRLLRASNSVSSGQSRRVSSIRDAIMLLGLGLVREWVSLMLLSDTGESDEARLASAILRAKLCQLVAARIGAAGEPAYTAGLLTAVAELVGAPIGELVERLPLAEDVAAALVGRLGPIGRALDIVDAYLAGDLDQLGMSPIPPADLTNAYFVATGYSTRSLARLAQSDEAD